LAEGSDVSGAKVSDLSGEILCASGAMDNKGKCNLVSYGQNMTVDSASELVMCNQTDVDSCHYMNSDNSTFSTTCDCAMNEAGSSWCSAAVKESKLILLN